MTLNNPHPEKWSTEAWMLKQKEYLMPVVWVFGVHNRSVQTHCYPQTLVTVTCENASNCCKHTHCICSSRNVYLHWLSITLWGKIISFRAGNEPGSTSLREAKETLRERHLNIYVQWPVSPLEQLKCQVWQAACPCTICVCTCIWGLPGYAGCKENLQSRGLNQMRNVGVKSLRPPVSHRRVNCFTTNLSPHLPFPASYCLNQAQWFSYLKLCKEVLVVGVW